MGDDGGRAGRLRAVLELGDEGFLEFRARPGDDGSVDYVFVDMNAAAEAAIGYRRDEVLGRGMRELFPNERTALVLAQFSGARAAGRVVVQELHLTEGRAAGWHRYKLIPTDDGVMVLSHRLVERVAQERAELLEQLRHAQKMESLGRLAGGIAHDFNNLLTPILAYINMALDRVEPSAPLYEDLREIREAADRAAALTRQILMFSRKQPNTPASMSLSAVVEGFARMLRLLVGDGVDLSLELSPDAGIVVVDPTQIEQVLANLAINARDAIVGEGRITIRTEDVSFGPGSVEVAAMGAPAGRYVMLSVHDTGGGIAPELRDRVFEPFFTTKGPAKGTGLGLAIVHGLVTRSGGYIRCDSEPGRGTTFRLYFPRVDAAPATRPPVGGAGGVAEAGGVATVLLVEDDEAVRRLARHILAERGYRVLEAEGGPAALELAARYTGPLDVLVTDVVMPRMDGRELHERLCALRPGLPAVFMSGYAEVEITGGRFLPKPFAASALLAVVREVLAG